MVHISSSHESYKAEYKYIRDTCQQDGPKGVTARVRRDLGVPPHSALPSPSFGPLCPPSPRHLRENLHPNPQYANQDNVACMQIQTCTHVNGTEGVSHIALLNGLVYATAEYWDLLTFMKAMKLVFADEWREACQYEIDALTKNGTWTLVDLPVGQKCHCQYCSALDNCFTVVDVRFIVMCSYKYKALLHVWCVEIYEQ